MSKKKYEIRKTPEIDEELEIQKELTNKNISDIIRDCILSYPKNQETIQDLKKDKQNLNNTIQDLQNEKKNNKNDIQNLKENNEKQNNTIQELKTNNENLTNTIKSNEEKSNNTIQTLKADIEKQNNYIQELLTKNQNLYNMLQKRKKSASTFFGQFFEDPVLGYLITLGISACACLIEWGYLYIIGYKIL